MRYKNQPQRCFTLFYFAVGKHFCCLSLFFSSLLQIWPEAIHRTTVNLKIESQSQNSNQSTHLNGNEHFTLRTNLIRILSSFRTSRLFFRPFAFAWLNRQHEQIYIEKYKNNKCILIETIHWTQHMYGKMYHVMYWFDSWNRLRLNAHFTI